MRFSFTRSFAPPRVNELFEVRVPRYAACLAERSGVVKAIETMAESGGYRLHFVSDPTPLDEEKSEEWTCDIPFGRKLIVQVGQQVEIGMLLAEGPLDPLELLRLLGQEAAQRALISEVQHVYRGTGAVIHDKHLEVIVRQMGRYVQIEDEGDTGLLPGEIIDRFTFMQQVLAILAQGGKPATARPLLLGLTNTILQTSSWIAAASFQDMSRVIAHAAIWQKQDDLIGLKERLVIGKQIPEIREKG
jgi:DNA-directed RNA polymerase subunit beta'